MNRSHIASEWFRGIHGSDPTAVDRFVTDEISVTYPIFTTLFNTTVVRGKPAVGALRFVLGALERDRN